jgi:2-iminobutanoate/2-iminopropanoate deaminase
MKKLAEVFTSAAAGRDKSTNKTTRRSMKSVLNVAARRNMEAIKEQRSSEDLAQAAQAIRLRSADAPAPDGLKAANAMPKALPSVAGAGIESVGASPDSANDIACRRIGNLLYISGVAGVNIAAKKVIMSYDDLPAHARQELLSLGFDTGQLSIDLLEAGIVAQSWMILSRIRAIAQQHGAQMSDVFKLVQYFRDLRQYPTYQRVRQLFCTTDVVSTTVEVSGLLPTSDVLILVEATVLLA